MHRATDGRTVVRSVCAVIVDSEAWPNSDVGDEL
jgi:hypothetical protein